MSSMTKIEPLGAVRERVLATLRQDIIAGRLRPGDRLVERELAERFGVSRVPVREAIRALVAEGFVHFETPRRTVVRRLTPNDVRELFELREALEVYAPGSPRPARPRRSWPRWRNSSTVRPPRPRRGTPR
jgi:DNA-binding GntR family transcriptional regulator